MRKAILSLLLGTTVFFGWDTLFSAEIPRSNALWVAIVRGPIDPAVKNYLLQGFDRAREDGAGAFLIRLDTPGGLLDATRDIVQGILNAPFPVIVHVAPRGARATSAGVFLLLAADVAAMAPHTHTGAAHPVQLGGSPGEDKRGNDTPLNDKILSDAVAYIRGLAETHGRNADWAEKAVRDSVSLTAEEARTQRVIDFLAEDESDLLAQLSQRKIKKDGRDVVWPTAASRRVAHDMSLAQRWLHVLAHPNVAYLLLTLGFYALIYELATPGVGLGAVVGVVSLVFAFFSLQVLPLNYAGLILILAGIVLMATDVLGSSHGLLMLGGLLTFGLGSFFLFDRSLPHFRISLGLILGTLAATSFYFGVALKQIFKARRLTPRVGAENLLGKTGELKTEGMVFLEGALWSTEGVEGLAPGDKVRVLEVLGTRLRVEKI